MSTDLYDPSMPTAMTSDTDLATAVISAQDDGDCLNAAEAIAGRLPVTPCATINNSTAATVVHDRAPADGADMRVCMNINVDNFHGKHFSCAESFDIKDHYCKKDTEVTELPEWAEPAGIHQEMHCIDKEGLKASAALNRRSVCEEKRSLELMEGHHHGDSIDKQNAGLTENLHRADSINRTRAELKVDFHEINSAESSGDSKHHSHVIHSKEQGTEVTEPNQLDEVPKVIAGEVSDKNYALKLSGGNEASDAIAAYHQKEEIISCIVQTKTLIASYNEQECVPLKCDPGFKKDTDSPSSEDKPFRGSQSSVGDADSSKEKRYEPAQSAQVRPSGMRRYPNQDERRDLGRDEKRRSSYEDEKRHAGREDRRHPSRDDQRNQWRDDQRRLGRDDQRHLNRDDQRHIDRSERKHYGRDDQWRISRDDLKYSGRDDRRRSTHVLPKYSGRDDQRHSGRDDARRGRDDNRHSDSSDWRYDGHDDRRQHSGKSSYCKPYRSEADSSSKASYQVRSRSRSRSPSEWHGKSRAARDSHRWSSPARKSPCNDMQGKQTSTFSKRVSPRKSNTPPPEVKHDYSNPNPEHNGEPRTTSTDYGLVQDANEKHGDTRWPANGRSSEERRMVHTTEDWHLQRDLNESTHSPQVAPALEPPTMSVAPSASAAAVTYAANSFIPVSQGIHDVQPPAVLAAKVPSSNAASLDINVTELQQSSAPSQVRAGQVMSLPPPLMPPSILLPPPRLPLTLPPLSLPPPSLPPLTLPPPTLPPLTLPPPSLPPPSLPPPLLLPSSLLLPPPPLPPAHMLPFGHRDAAAMCTPQNDVRGIDRLVGIYGGVTAPYAQLHPDHAFASSPPPPPDVYVDKTSPGEVRSNLIVIQPSDAAVHTHEQSYSNNSEKPSDSDDMTEAPMDMTEDDDDDSGSGKSRTFRDYSNGVLLRDTPSSCNKIPASLPPPADHAWAPADAVATSSHRTDDAAQPPPQRVIDVLQQLQQLLSRGGHAQLGNELQAKADIHSGVLGAVLSGKPSSTDLNADTLLSKAKRLPSYSLSATHMKAKESPGSDIPSSATELSNIKVIEKMNRQERIAEEVKVVLKPYYSSGKISKTEYKEVMKKAVHKIYNSKSGAINPVKVKAFVDEYVAKTIQVQKLLKKRQRQT